MWVLWEIWQEWSYDLYGIQWKKSVVETRRIKHERNGNAVGLTVLIIQEELFSSVKSQSDHMDSNTEFTRFSFWVNYCFEKKAH